MRSIGLPELILVLGVGLCILGIVLAIFYLISLQRVLERCSPQSRTLPPGRVWLLLIPLFNIVWHFIVVNHVAHSLRNEYTLRGLALSEPEPARSIGFAMGTLSACSVIPHWAFRSALESVESAFWIVSALGGFLCWIMYWVKVSKYSQRLVPPLPAAVRGFSGGG